LLGVLIFFAGFALAYSNPNTYYRDTIYPNAVDGAIVVLMGLVTIAVGFAIPEDQTKEKAKN